MDCKTSQQMLDAYLDNELERSDARALEAHVDSCADCRDALSSRDALRRALHAPGLRYTAPDALRTRIAASSVQPAARRRSTPWLRYAAAAVLAFTAGGICVQMWNMQQSTQQRLTRDLLAGHWRALAAASPVDVVSSDRHTVRPWFAGKLAQAPLVQDFAEQGFPLAGGRIDYLGDARVPVLVYRHGQHVIDVYVLPAGTTHNLPAAALENGYRVAPVNLGGEPAAVVSDLDESELVRFHQLLSQVK